MELIIGLGLILFAVIGFNMNKANNQREQRLQKIKEQRAEIFERKKIEYNVPNGCSIITCMKGHNILVGKVFVWIDDNILHLCPAQSHYDEKYYTLYKIPILNIEYFSTQGQITHETKISGGGGTGGGVSIAGAVVGGVIAGPVGAIIGSRKKTNIEPIKSTTTKKDNRETFINFYENGEKSSLFFAFDDFSTLLKLIPSKSYENFVKLSSSSQNMQESIVEQIKGLADLRDKGIITEDEFNLKKKQLLGI